MFADTKILKAKFAETRVLKKYKKFYVETIYYYIKASFKRKS